MKKIEKIEDVKRVADALRWIKKLCGSMETDQEACFLAGYMSAIYTSAEYTNNPKWYLAEYKRVTKLLDKLNKNDKN